MDQKRLSLTVLPAVDPIREEHGAQGIVVAHIFAVHAGSVEAFAQRAEATFASYRAAGAHEVGVLTTLDAPNNYPRLAIRSDGPFLVWLGILNDDQTLAEQFQELAERSAQTLAATEFLRDASELLILDPARRSPLRWLPGM